MADTVREQLIRHADSDSPAILFEDSSIIWRDYIAGANARAGALAGMLDPTRPRHIGTLLENTPYTRSRCRKPFWSSRSHPRDSVGGG